MCMEGGYEMNTILRCGEWPTENYVLLDAGPVTVAVAVAIAVDNLTFHS